MSASLDRERANEARLQYEQKRQYAERIRLQEERRRKLEEQQPAGKSFFEGGNLWVSNKQG